MLLHLRVARPAGHWNCFAQRSAQRPFFHPCAALARGLAGIGALPSGSLSPTAADAIEGQSPQDEPAAEPAAPHLPVLLREVLDCFAPVKLQVYVDGTLGAGGHATALLEAHPEMSVLAGIDVDPLAHRLARARLEAVHRPSVHLHLLQGNHCDVERLLRSVPQEAGAPSLFGRVNGMLLDLGVSSMQFDTAERGFSLMREKDGPLDMRMGPSAAASAEEIINTWSEAELGRIIRDYGEEKLWRVVASRIAQRREAAPILTTQQLVTAIGQTALRGKGAGGGKRRAGGAGIHPATRTFQALRIAVNDELNKLEKALPAALSCLARGGRLAVISFHSLEDRIVKHALMRACGQTTPDEEHLTRGAAGIAFQDVLDARAVATKVTRKPLTAGEEELLANPRARSAKLRVVQKL